MSKEPKDEGRKGKTVIPIKTDRTETKEVSCVVLTQNSPYKMASHSSTILIRRLNSYSA